MLIDWVTVGAQALNFLILVWLLKRFLYKPILDAIDARETRIAAELADADATKAEAEKERNEFQRKNEEFDRQRDEKLSKVQDEVKTERSRLLDDARQAADALRAKRQDALHREQQSLSDEITPQTREEVFAIARKTLTDLAGTSLEASMSEAFVRHVRELDGDAKETLAKALKPTADPALVRSAFDLPTQQRETIQQAINETFSADIRLQFEIEPTVISGIELIVNGRKVAWSIANHLASLGKSVESILKAQRKPQGEAGSTPEGEGETPEHETETPMSAESGSLESIFDRAFAGISHARESFTPQFVPREVGTVASISTGIAHVTGLPGVGFDELLEFAGGVSGIAFNVDEDEIGVVLLGEYWNLEAGDEVERTGRVMDVAVGEELLGRVIDPLGRPLDGGGPVEHAADKRLPIERPAPPIMDRAPVTEPLQTGLKVIDALIPIGRGQRELILGDRQTGKTAVAIDTILSQQGRDVVCVYCAIGQRAAAVAKVVALLQEKGAMEYTVVVVTEGNDPPGLAYIAPYAATSIAESFMEAGRDVLIVYDDLTQHARAYRELSLLLRRPPGREAFPGDIFYIHSRLLERATHLRTELGGGSLTALPIIETEAQNIAAYIPTNLISITDGQIYLSPSLFELGVLPAIDVGKSVSRVGGKAQRAAYRAVAGDLKLAYAQFEELETFARFGARLDEDTRTSIEHGRRIRACLKQPESAAVSVPEQIAILLALTAGLFDPIPIGQMRDAEKAVREAVAGIPAEVAERLDTADSLSDEDRETIVEIARESLARFLPKPEDEAEADADDGDEAEANPEAEHKAEAEAEHKAEPGTDGPPEVRGGG